MRKHYLLAGLGLSSLTAAVLAQGQAPIVISASVAVTGNAASLGASEANMISLLEKRINAAGGVGGRPLKINVYDDNSDPQKAVLNVRKGIIEDKAVAVICCTTTPLSLAAKDTATRSKVTMMSMAATASIVEPPAQNQWIFKTPPSDKVMVQATLRDMQARKFKRLAFIGFADAYGEGGLTGVQQYLSRFGLELVATEKFNRTDTDTTAQATRIVASKPDVVLVWAIPPGAVTAHRSLIAAGFKGQIYQSYGVTNPDFLRLGGKDVEGTLIQALPIAVYDQLAPNVANRSALDDIMKSYPAAYSGQMPSSFTGHAWDAVSLLVEAVNRALKAGGDPARLEAFRKSVRDELEGIRGFQGVSGTFNLSKTDHVGLSSNIAQLVTVKDGKYVLAGSR